jgi:serine protease inhibitor
MYDAYRAGHRSRYNKEELHESSNNKLNNRDFQSMGHASRNFGNFRSDVDRLLMERNGFNTDTIDDYKIGTASGRRNSRGKKKRVRKRAPEDGYGEITGRMIHDNNQYDKGMPMRSSYSVKKEVFDQNAYLDFDLFDKHKPTKNNVGYFDPDGGGLCTIDKSTNIISKKADPIHICIDGIGNLSIFLHNNIGKIMNDAFNINAFGLYHAFAELYYGSIGNSEIELKNYFSFCQKNVVERTMRGFMDKDLKSTLPYLTQRSFVFNDRFVPISKEFAKHSHDVLFITVDNSHPKEEAERVNDIIEKTTGCQNILSGKTVKHMEVSIVNVMRFAPTWALKVDSVVLDSFMGMKTEFIKFTGQSFGFYEDGEKLVLEIPCKHLKLGFGIVLPKGPVMFNKLDYDNLMNCIDSLKGTVIDEVMLPRVAKRVKMRLNNILQNTDLRAIFIESDLPDIYPKGAKLNDVLQYCDLVIDAKCVNKGNTIRGYQVMRKIKINKAFSYYIRYAPKNIILSTGHIC